LGSLCCETVFEMDTWKTCPPEAVLKLPITPFRDSFSFLFADKPPTIRRNGPRSHK
jgi:hypothetical protein